jgi:hypothetical protein
MYLHTVNTAAVDSGTYGLPISIKEATTAWQDVIGTFAITPGMKQAYIKFQFIMTVTGDTFDLDEVMISPARTGALAPNNAIQTALPGTPTLTVTEEVPHATHSITTLVQLKDSLGFAPITPQLVRLWVSDTAGGAEVTTATSTAAAPTGTIQTVTASKHWLAMTTATGTISSVLINTTGAKTVYLNVEWLGRVTSSAAITFSA